MEALSSQAIEAALSELPGWALKDNALERVYGGKSYLDALDKLYAIGQLAEAEDHHPDMRLDYKRLTIRFWTHTAKGVTQRDVDLARKVSELLA